MFWLDSVAARPPACRHRFRPRMILSRCLAAFRRVPVAGDAGDLADAGVVDQALRRRHDADGTLLQSAVRLVEVLREAVGRGPPAGGSRDGGARPSARPRAGAPPASPGGPRPRTRRCPREPPDGPGRIPYACESTCRERRASSTKRQRKLPAPPKRARATHVCPTSSRIKRTQAWESP